MNKSAAEAEREVEASRGQLDRTVEALKDKMTPGQLFDEASHAVGGLGQQLLTTFVEQAKRNPIPLAVTGLGLAWLMTSSGRAAQSSGSGNPDYGRGHSSAQALAGGDGGGIGEQVRSFGAKASDLVSGAKEKLAAGASSATDAGFVATHNLGSLAGTAADKAGSYGYRAQRTFLDVLDREPLLIGALGVMVGVAVGAALPATDAEDRLVGTTRDHIVEKGKEFAQDGLHQAADAAQAAYGAIKSEMTQSGGEPADLSRKVQDASRAGVQAAKDTLQGGSPH